MQKRALALVMLVAGRASGMPMSRALGAATLAMTASLLIPIEPYDGAYLSRRTLLATEGATVVIAGPLFAGVL